MNRDHSIPAAAGEQVRDSTPGPQCVLAITLLLCLAVARVRSTVTLPATDILDIDYSTAGSAAEAMRRAAEQRVQQLGHSRADLAPASGRTERLLIALTKYGKSRGVTVKSRQGLPTFGKGLGDDEVHYLYAVVRRALVDRGLP